jgi:hypothetical protein
VSLSKNCACIVLELTEMNFVAKLSTCRSRCPYREQNFELRTDQYCKIKHAIQVLLLNQNNRVQSVQFIVRLVSAGDSAFFSHRPTAIADNSRSVFPL